MNVDFPQPDGPISAVTVPDEKSKEISRSARWLPNQAWILRASRPEPIADVPGAFWLREFATSAKEEGFTRVASISSPFSSPA